jgi:hypothetical protein
MSVAAGIQHATRKRRIVWLYQVFPFYLTNGTIFGKAVLNMKCVF